MVIETRRAGLILLGGGSALLLEHVIVNGVSVDGVMCHGLYGIIMILLSTYILRKK